jgi:cation:H+ antiporter
LLLSIGAIIIGLIILVWSADKFVEGASATANHLGVPTLLIGMVIVGFGTSAPEVAVAAIAAMDGNPNLALGNAFGSNIANIALILGVTALLVPIAVHSSIIKKEFPILIIITLFSGFILLNGVISRTEGIILLLGFVAIIVWQVYTAIKNKKDSLATESEEEIEGLDMSLKQGIFWLIAGIVLLVISSKMLVWGAVNIATALGVSDLIIGLTIVAVGTSLPELAAAIAAVKKGEHDLAIGNVVGSNMFNILLVIGVGAVITPMTNIPDVALYRDFLVMLGLTIALFIMAYGFNGKDGHINRIEGGLLLFAFIAYMGMLTFTSLALL